MNQIDEENNNIYSDSGLEDDIDLEDLEMPQLVRRNGTMNKSEIQVHFILEKNSEHIYTEELCPICLSEEKELYPLRCGHTFCEDDIQILVDNSKQEHNLLMCPICRQYQCIESFQEVSQLKVQWLNNFQKPHQIG